ncbi:patatin-like phospholipase domain-containing protein [Ditylenchus destructor]|uniref:Patatin-like phospholipase domain-containing protein n=1 Tax=Ditylenchus destructor TaxID=166010 RepID=A0AAD4MHT2_9BILA|nr:patatin-like phospholipase domain-containing protein [Ditylenchus destructor]
MRKRSSRTRLREVDRGAAGQRPGHLQVPVRQHRPCSRSRSSWWAPARCRRPAASWRSTPRGCGTRARNSWEPCTISNGPSNAYRGISMVDAALATSAAPTYFPPYQVGSYGYFADGGTFANNPSMTAMVEAIYQGYASGTSDILMLSLGTGVNPVGISPGSVPNPLDWGVTHWLWPFGNGTVPATALLNLTMDATAELAAIQAGQMLGGNYMRGNVPLAQPFGLDDYRNVGELVSATQDYIKNSSEWAKVRDWVETNWK